MTFSPNTFDVKKWDFDQSIFDSIPKEIPAIPELGGGPIVGVSKKSDVEIPMAILGVQWEFEIYHANRKILYFLVHVDYWANISERKDDKGDLNRMITDSYSKVRAEYDKRKRPIGISLGMPPLEASSLDSLREQLLQMMKSKGI